MKKFLLVLCLLFFTVKIFAQQFSQYNTGSLYDSFENLGQRAFVPDTSKQFASNFLIPNFNFDFFLSGNAQATLKNRAFLNKYDNSALMINQGKLNHVNVNANAYFIMVKMFTSLKGDEEMGFSWQTKADGKGLFTDESIAAFNGTQSFNTATPYNNIFNSNYYYQTYHQVSFTYHEKIDKKFSFGIKISAVLGIDYQKLDITNSKVVFDKVADTSGVSLKGKYYESYIPGHLSSQDYLPTLRNPGASITIGTLYKTQDAFIVQANIKDLGFIDWSKRSDIYGFDGHTIIKGLSTPAREDSIYNKIRNLVHNNVAVGSFTTPIDGRAELSVSRSFWIDDDKTFKYSPTAIASKELFYPGFVAALVNPVQYKNYTLTLTTTYDDLKTFNLGAQFMVKSPNMEFYIGSDKLTQTIGLVSDRLNTSSPNITQNSAYTGADFFLGFSLKFGPVIEHPMNASHIPTGEKGFLGRLWNRLFKTYD